MRLTCTRKGRLDSLWSSYRCPSWTLQHLSRCKGKPSRTVRLLASSTFRKFPRLLRIWISAKIQTKFNDRNAQIIVHYFLLFLSDFSKLRSIRHWHTFTKHWLALIRCVLLTHAMGQSLKSPLIVNNFRDGGLCVTLQWSYGVLRKYRGRR